MEGGGTVPGKQPQPMVVNRAAACSRTDHSIKQTHRNGEKYLQVVGSVVIVLVCLCPKDFKVSRTLCFMPGIKLKASLSSKYVLR